MTEGQWYYAHLRWAVMVEGKQGLREWKEAVHLFRSLDDQTAFEQALAIGFLAEEFYTEGRRKVEIRLAEVVGLGCLIGYPGTHFEVARSMSKPRESLPFEHIFHPEEDMPLTIF